MSRCENCSKISVKTLFEKDRPFGSSRSVLTWFSKFIDAPTDSEDCTYEESDDGVRRPTLRPDSVSKHALGRLSGLIDALTDVEDNEDDASGTQYDSNDEDTRGILIAKDVAELERSAAAGCNLCGMAWQALHFVHRDEDHGIIGVPAHSNIRLCSGGEDWDTIGRIAIRSDCKGACKQFVGRKTGKFLVNDQGRGTFLGPAGLERLLVYIGSVGRVEMIDTTHEVTADQTRIFDRDLEYLSNLAQGWLNVCDFEHDCLSTGADKKPSGEIHKPLDVSQSVSASNSVIDSSPCSANQGNHDIEFLPPRLIHISGNVGSPSLRLIDTTSLEEKARKEVRYCALSYCWGGCKQNSTTQSNLADRYNEIRYEELLRTLRDAIQVTLSTQIQYIWIDSLCIVQGHSGAPALDWSKHVSIMGLIYERAYYTLLASNAPNADSGFLHRTNAWHARFNVRACRIPYSLAKTSPYLTYAFEYTEDHRENGSSEPLEQRAWAMQESVLSSRRLIFKDTGIEFECKRKLAHETQPLLLERPRTWNRRCGNLTYWHGLVADFCRLRISFDKDKLAAFEGIAQEYCRRSNLAELFIAGIRRSAYIEDLGWINTSVSCARNSSFPSWSWASVSFGNIDFPKVEKEASLNLIWESGKIELQTLSMLRADWVHAGSPGFSATWDTRKTEGDGLVQASIEVRGVHGRIRGIELLYHEFRERYWSYRLCVLRAHAVFFKDPGVVIDPERDDYKWVLSRAEDIGMGWGRPPVFWALILEAVNQQELSWRRIGVLEIEELGLLGVPRGSNCCRVGGGVTKKPRVSIEQDRTSGVHKASTRTEQSSSHSTETGNLILV